MERTDLKSRVKAHWEREACGARYGDDVIERRRYFAEIEARRYEQDYMIRDFARFPETRGKRVLEVGLGTGSDFLGWVRSGALAFGRDITQASVDLVRERLDLEGLRADVAVGDAEALDFPSDFFDLYYSWGVLHHTPDTEAAMAEAYRVLKPGGTLKLMLYHCPSVGALLVWLAHGPLRGDLRSVRAVYADHVESPGTKSYTKAEVARLIGRSFDGRALDIRTYLGSGDLLTQRRSDRYSSRVWGLAQALYPRWLVRHVLGHRFGTVMTIQTTKQGGHG